MSQFDRWFLGITLTLCALFYLVWVPMTLNRLAAEDTKWEQQCAALQAIPMKDNHGAWHCLREVK